MRRGIAISPGVTVGTAYCIEAIYVNPDHVQLRPDQIPSELARLDAAIDAVASDLRKLQSRVHFQLGTEAAAVFSVHESILRDRAMSGRLRDSVRKERISSQEALRRLMEEYEHWMAQHSDALLRERISDIRDVGQRLSVYLSDALRGEVPQLAGPVVVVAGQRVGKPMTVCGEMAGQPESVALLLGMGVERLSMSPALIPAIKELVAKMTRPMAEKLFVEALQMRTTAEVRQLAHRFIENVAPDLDPLVARS